MIYSLAEESVFVFSNLRIPHAFVRVLALVAFALSTPVGPATAQSSCSNCSNLQVAPQLLPYAAKVVVGVTPVVPGTGSGDTPGNSMAVSGNVTLACPSGLTAADKYGDGCLATEIALTAPRYAIADTAGNIFFSDYTNGLVRRVDATTGAVSIVAGGATSSPNPTGSTCATDYRGDGCMGTSVHLVNPEGLAFATNGDLVFADSGTGQYDVRRIAANTGTQLVPAAGGIISNVAGYTGSSATVTRGYTSGMAAATASYLYSPYGVTTDAKGNIFIAEEGKNAIMVVNTNTSSDTVNGIAIPAGQIVKITGAYGTSKTATPAATCPNGTSGTYGCSYNPYVEGAAANDTWLDSPYGMAVDPTGVVYIANEFNNVVPSVSSAGLLATYAGNQNNAAGGMNVGERGTAGASLPIGSDYGVAVDPLSNLYITDALNGVVWRVDGGSKDQYIVAGGVGDTGGAAAICSTSQGATDSYGDGCPALMAKFGQSNSGGKGYAASGNAAGIWGVSVDPYSNLFVGDTLTGLIREITTDTQFGAVFGFNQPVQTIEVHYSNGDGPSATNPYVVTSGSSNFSVGTPGNCTANSDGTMDCLVPIKATPSTAAVGPFSGTLTVTSSMGHTASFALSGTYVNSPITGVALTFTSPTTNCVGSSTFAPTTPLTLTATLTANGPNPPSGTITFYATPTSGGTATTLGVVNVGNIGTTTKPVYGAILTGATLSTPGTYNLSATYSGDTAAPIYFTGSSSAPVGPVTSTTPTFSTAISSGYTSQSTVSAGQTGLFSLTLTQSVYTGTITFSCTGLPANSSCVFSPNVIQATTGCSTSNTVALSILTSGGVPAQTAIGLPGRGPWQMLTMILGLGLALLIGLRRRRLPMSGLWMAMALLLASSGLMACSNSVSSLPVTPSGTYNVVAVANGSSGGVTFNLPITLIVK